MKIISLSLCFVALMLLGCNSFPQQGLLPGVLGKGIQAAIEQKDIQVPTSLASLNSKSSKKLWKQFFQERGASKFWEQLQGSIDSLKFEFEYLETEEAGIADEVAAGIVQYLGYYHKKQINSLILRGSRGNSNQKLIHLPASIGQLTSLQLLNLSYNQLQELPAEIGQLTSLQNFYLERNQLQELPAAIGQLSRLQLLSLGDNQLQNLPAEISQLTRLVQLYLGRNTLPSLSERLYARKVAGLQVYSGNNPFLQAAQLTPLKGDSLASYAYQGLPRSLRTLCAQYINQHPATFPEEHIANLLPQELSKEGRETMIKQECQWPQQVQIVFFDGHTPFYLDRQLCTPQDVKDLLEEFKDKQLYLVPKD